MIRFPSFTSVRSSEIHYANFPEFSHHCLNEKELSLLQKLGSCKSVKELKGIHSSALKSCPSLQTQQLMYAEILCLCASITPLTDLGYVHSLLKQLPNPNTSLYNSLIRYFLGFGSNQSSLIVLLCYRVLIEKGLVADSYTYPFVFKACAHLCAMREGKMLHANVIKNGFVMDLYVVNTLMRFYAAIGAIEDVRKVFDGSPQWDLVSWTTLTQGYVNSGYWKKGLDVFFHICDVGYIADGKLMVVVISACAKLGDLSLGVKLHKYINDYQVKFDVFIGNALIDMYLKCGDADSARKVFYEMPLRNVVSWNSMISGLAQKGDFREALSMFRKMQDKKVKLDEFTLVAVLNSCANLGALDLGKWIHAYLNRNQIEADGLIGNALIDMYAKCGNIPDALGVFDEMKLKDVYTYSTTIIALAMHGEGQTALELYSEMLEIGIQPDEVTFVGVLTACTHAGLLEEGRKCFADMLRVHNIKPQLEHYGCMVDLLGRVGLINEAVEFIENMSVEPDAFILGALLGACRIHGEVELAEIVMEQLAKVESDKDGPYILMSNIYASADKQKEALQLRKGMKHRKLRKAPGCSSIELDGEVYEFRKGDKAHPKTESIYHMLSTISCHLYDASNW